MPDPVRIVLATRNRHKVAEIVEALELPGVVVESLDAHPNTPEVFEDGDSFEVNALKKAREVAAAIGLPALADDSGLEVDALDGAPGVRSARFAGPDAGDAENRAELVERLKDEGRGPFAARFVCVLALALPDGSSCSARGTCEGEVRTKERGDGGFGYDSLFVPEGEERTFAEMSRAEKATMSHRGRALAQAGELVKSLIPSAATP